MILKNDSLGLTPALQTSSLLRRFAQTPRQMSESQEPELRVKGFGSRGWLWVDDAAVTSRETQLVKVENSHLSQTSFWSCGSSEGSVSRDIYACALHT